MERLSLNSFISNDTDFEANQYKVLAGLQEFRSDFAKEKLYPSLSELVDLYSQLNDLFAQKNNLKVKFPKQITDYDIENKKLIYDTISKLDPDIEILFDLIEWAIPQIKGVIEEGLALYEYVDKNIEIRTIGVLPVYRDEGYLILPNNIDCVILVHRYSVSIFSSNNTDFRALKTEFIEAIKQTIISPVPNDIKLNLVKKYKDLPNPATFICETDLDFPFSETIFPVVKRKLIAQLAA